MSIETIQIRPAAMDDVPELVTILQEAKTLKNSKGDNTWGPYPFTTTEVAETVAIGNTYVAAVDGQPAATIDLAWNDARMWGPDKGNDNQAAYIHRIAVRQAYRGQHVGELILAWAAAEAIRAERPLLRLDCSYQNRKLCSIYEAMGFKEVGRKDLSGPDYSVAFYEKPVI